MGIKNEKKLIFIIVSAIIALSAFFYVGCGDIGGIGSGGEYEFTLNNLDDDEVSMEELEGKVVFIKFWGMDCLYCIIGLPKMDSLTQEYQGEEDVEILTINLTDGVNEIKSILEDDDLEIEVLLDEEGEAEESFGVYALPTYYALDSDGSVGFTEEGSISFEEAVDVIEELK